MTIKRTSEGKIITRDGKPSCTCCCPCGGLASANDLQLSIDVTSFHGIETLVESPWFGAKISACVWIHGSTQSNVQWVCATNMWVCAENTDGGVVLGYRAAAFVDGPAGDYYDETDGTGTLMQTVE